MHAIFDNATTYNGATSDIGKLAAELKRVFDQKLAEMALAVKDRIRQRMIDESLPAAPPPPPVVGPPPRQRSLLAPPPRSRSRNESEVSDDDDLPYAPSKPASSSAAKFGGKRPAVTFRSSGSTPRKRARPVISFGKGKRPRKYVAGWIACVADDVPRPAAHRLVVLAPGAAVLPCRRLRWPHHELVMMLPSSLTWRRRRKWSCSSSWSSMWTLRLYVGQTALCLLPTCCAHPMEVALLVSLCLADAADAE